MLFKFSSLKHWGNAFVAALFLLAWAQAYAAAGKLRVTLNDAVTERPVAGAEVTAIFREGGETRAATDTNGVAVLEQLAPGLYEVKIFHPSYQSARQPTLRVVDSKTTTLPLKLTALREHIEEVVVVGTAIAGDHLSSVGTGRIDRDALSSAAGSGGDALRALDGLPGLFSDGEFSSFTVRGNGPRDNLILVDGIPFENVVHYSDAFGSQEEVEGGGRYSVFAPNILAGAEFQPGGWSSAYGGRAGSLLKLDVAEGNPDSASYTARLDIAGVEIGYDGPSRLHESTSVLLSARDYNFGRLFEIIGLDDVGTPKLTDIILKTTTELSGGDKLNFLAIYAPEEYFRDTDNVLASDEDEPGNYQDEQLIEHRTDNTLYAVTWSHLLGRDSEMTNQLYVRTFDERNRIGEAYPDLVPQGTPAAAVPARHGILNSQREEQEIGWQLDLAADNFLGRLSGGVRVTQVDLAFELALAEDWIRYVYDQNDFRDPAQEYVVLTPAAVNNQYVRQEVNYAVYLDQEFSLADWSFRAGARYDHDAFAEENLISPRFGATWAASDKWRVTATTGRYFQAPRANDRASDVGNAGLENEVVDQLSVGFAYRPKDDIEIFVEPYYQDLDNLVVEQDGVNQTLGNSGKGDSYGVDTAITRQFERGWSANVKYSYNRARVRDYPGAQALDAEYSRPHSVSVGGVWEISERWKLSSRWKWASGKPRDEFVVHADVLGEGEPLRYSKEIVATNVGRYKNYNSLNFRVDYRRAFGRTHLIAFLDVLNVLGSDNPSNAEFNERAGEDVVEEGEALPLFGFQFEW